MRKKTQCFWFSFHLLLGLLNDGLPIVDPDLHTGQSARTPPSCEATARGIAQEGPRSHLSLSYFHDWKTQQKHVVTVKGGHFRKDLPVYHVFENIVWLGFIETIEV